MVRRGSKLAVQGCEVVEDVEEFVFEVVLDERSFGIVSKGGVPRKICADLHAE